MAYADQIFIDMCKSILELGTDTTGEEVRPHWEDGSLAYTIKKFGVCNVYDLRKGFPALTLRPTNIRAAVDEVLWIYQKKSNNIHDLNSHIWDEWADETGSIGKAYGWQVANKKVHRNIDGVPVIMDQMDAVLHDLKTTPYSRRIKINLYAVEDLEEMRLQPCCYDLTFNVTKEVGYDKLVLNMVLNQRSNDVLAANNWNVCQYAALLMMVAQSVDMYPGKLMHCIADAHIYDRHVNIIKELIEREPIAAGPTVRLKKGITDFYKFTPDDIEVVHYQHHPQVKQIPIAI